MQVAAVARRLGSILCGALLACCASAAHAGSVSGVYTGATFIGSAHPDNNNGGAGEIYLGNDLDYGSVMRGLIRFSLPTNLAGRAVVMGANLGMTTGSVATIGFAPATVSAERLLQSWTQGTGGGNPDPYGNFTIGAACSSGAGGATWNQPTCSGTGWSSGPGGYVAGVSAVASVSSGPGQPISWTSSQMNSDVQGWLDNPPSNYGWLLQSSTESNGEQALAKSGSLNVTYSCKSAFLETPTGYCTTCTTAAKSACVTSQTGNTCNDSGPPSTTYTCTCGNAAYSGTGTMSCVDKNECIPNHCTDRGDTMAMCTDHVAPATGYSCTCDAGFYVSGGTCIDVVFADGFGP